MVEALRALCKKYGFSFRKQSEDDYGIFTKNTDGRFRKWIGYYRPTGTVNVIGNTDNLNIWLCETRPDLTMEKTCDFVKELAKISKRPLRFPWRGLNPLPAGVYEGKSLIFSDVIDWEDIQEMPHSDPAFDVFDGTNIDECVEAYCTKSEASDE